MVRVVGLQRVCGKDRYGVHAVCSRVKRLNTLRILAISSASFLKGEMAPMGDYEVASALLPGLVER